MLVAYNCLELQFQGIGHPLLASAGICTYAHTHKYSHIHIFKIFLQEQEEEEESILQEHKQCTIFKWKKINRVGHDGGYHSFQHSGIKVG